MPKDGKDMMRGDEEEDPAFVDGVLLYIPSLHLKLIELMRFPRILRGQETPPRFTTGETFGGDIRM